MATKKELVEACSYSRRRLVAAFVSGAPGGHEAEPRRVGRTVVGGLALAVLLIAGAAVASVLTPQTPDDWNRVGLVVTRGDRPATYLILEESAHPTLIPVINLTSAQLILGADVTATALDQRLVDEQRPAIPIGIVGAPQTLPRSDAFIQTGWTACTADDVGVAVDLATDVKVEVAPGAGLIVRSADRLWLIATSSRREARDRRTYRYPIASAVDENLFVGYGLGALAEALDVPPGWLALFPEGGEVGPQGFGVPLGRPALDPPVPGAHVGDYVVGQGGGGAMVVDGGFQALDPFALAVLQSLRSRVNVVELAAGLPASYLPSTYAASHWPDAALRPLDSQPCAQLDVEPGRPPRAWLAGDPTGTAAVPEPDDADAIAVDGRRLSIQPGHGAFVQSGTWDQTAGETPYVVDPLGRAYQLVGGSATLDKLHYDLGTAPQVPAEWIALFDPGVDLSISAALCPADGGPDPPAPERCWSPP